MEMKRINSLSMKRINSLKATGAPDPIHISRACRVTELLLRAGLSATWGLLDVLRDSSPTLIWMRVAATAVACSFALALFVPNCPARVANILVAFAVVLWNGLVSCGQLVVLHAEAKVHYCIQGCPVVLVLNLMTLALPPEFNNICIFSHVVTTLAVQLLSMAEGEGEYWMDAINHGVILVILLAFVMRAQLKQLELHSQLKAEQTASKLLITMLCDACFWLGEDADTIVRGDRTLDDIMGKDMEGTKLTDCLSESERRRFKGCADDYPGSVRLLPVTLLLGSKPPVRGELFVVNQGPHIGYLIGLRLPDVAADRDELRCACTEVGMTGTDTGHTMVTGAPSDGSNRVNSYRNNLDIETGTVASSTLSQPRTLASRALEMVTVRHCGREEAVGRALEALEVLSPSPKLEATLRSAVALCCDVAVGGALVIVAEAWAFLEVFSGDGMPRNAAHRPALKTSDGGYMTRRLKRLHISDARFVHVFRAFSEPTETDRWPWTHEDPTARNQPKDGALLLDASGYRLKCAVKLLGLPPARAWPGVGTKHEAAAAAVWAVEGCVAVVRSSEGVVHTLVREGSDLHVYCVQRCEGGCLEDFALDPHQELSKEFSHESSDDMLHLPPGDNMIMGRV